MLKLENIPLRSAVSPKDTWNVTSLYPSIEAWKKDFSKVTNSATPPYWPHLSSFKGRLREGTSLVKEAINSILSVERELKKLHTYVTNVATKASNMHEDLVKEILK